MIGHIKPDDASVPETAWCEGMVQMPNIDEVHTTINLNGSTRPELLIAL
jgi:hypothetical protein